MALKLEKRCAEYAIFPLSLATEGAAHCYSPQPVPGWWCQTAGAFQIHGSNLAKPRQPLKQWGRVILATKQEDQRREKLPIGDDEQVGRSNWFISERNVNRALQSLEQLLGGAAGASPQPHVSTLFIALPSCS